MEKKEKDLIKKILIYSAPIIIMALFSLANYIKAKQDQEARREQSQNGQRDK